MPAYVQRSSDDSRRTNSALDDVFQRRWSLLALDTESGQLTIGTVRRISAFGSELVFTAQSQLFDELYDGTYGHPSLEHMRRRTRKSAVIDDVDAIIKLAATW